MVIGRDIGTMEEPKEVSLDDLVTAKFTELGLNWNLVEAACWSDERKKDQKQRLSFDVSEIRRAFRDIKDRGYVTGAYLEGCDDFDNKVRFYLWHSSVILFPSSSDEISNYRIEAIPRYPTSQVKPRIVNGLS